jgi:hypothetical protein
VFLHRILSALATVTDSHRIQSALRLLIHLCPLILQRMPELIPDMLSLTLPALDTSDPFKTVQALTFYIIFFSHVKATDISHLDAENFQINSFLSVRNTLVALNCILLKIISDNQSFLLFIIESRVSLY